MLCLDNDVFRTYTDQPPDPAVVEYLEANASAVWLLPSVVLFEFLHLYDSHAEIRAKRRAVERVVDDVVVLDADVATEAANISARLRATDTSLDLADLLVAASAREAGATLVTGNSTDFDKAPVHELVDVDIVEGS